MNRLYYPSVFYVRSSAATWWALFFLADSLIGANSFFFFRGILQVARLSRGPVPYRQNCRMLFFFTANRECLILFFFTMPELFIGDVAQILLEIKKITSLNFRHRYESHRWIFCVTDDLLWEMRVSSLAESPTRVK